MHHRATNEGYGAGKRHSRQEVRTTVPDTAQPCPLDKVNRQFRVPAPDRLWVSDFTYVATWSGFVFVIGAFARRIKTTRQLRNKRSKKSLLKALLETPGVGPPLPSYPRTRRQL